MKYILITGARDYPDLISARVHLRDALSSEGTTLIHGTARGIDSDLATFAAAYFRYHPQFLDNGSRIIGMPAEWTLYGKRAGPIRNQQMVKYVVERKDKGHEVTCLAFPLEPRQEHSGTWDCIDRIRRARLELWIYPMPANNGTD